MIIGAVIAATLVGIASLTAGVLPVAAAAAVWRRWTDRHRRTDLDDMPGHPEAVRDPADPLEAEEFDDIAETLLDDGLADVAEELGWIR